MERNGGSEASLEEMWEIIERFGIRRDTYELKKPTIQEIRNLYHAIVEKRGSLKSTS